ncbi:MAG: DMT family transporter [Acidimicrobiia bacterium]
MSDQHERRALLLALFVTVLWASSWVIIRYGMDDEGLRPITFAGLRYTTAAIVLIGVVAFRPGAREAVRLLDRRQVVGLAVLGVILIAIAQGAQFVALDNQPAATTSLVLSMTPLLVALVAGVSLGEKATKRQFLGAALVAAGAVLYFSGSLAATAAGMAAALVCLVANGAGSLLGRNVNRDLRRSPLVTTTVSMAFGAIVLLAAGLATEGIPTVSGRAWLFIGWLAVVNTAFAFTIWNHTMRHLTATESAAINNTMLIQIAILAWIFLGERPSAIQVIGILAVTVGITLGQRVGWRLRRDADQPVPPTAGAK